MKETKDTKNARHATYESIPFDGNAEYRFRVNAWLAPGDVRTIEFTLDGNGKDGKGLTYDEVEDCGYGMMESRFPMDYYPRVSRDGDIEVWRDAWYPVLGDSADTADIDAAKHAHGGVLVLPERVYMLHPAFLLYTALVESGLIDADSRPYDAAMAATLNDTLKKLETYTEGKKE